MKKLTAIIMCIAMILTAIPLYAFAETEVPTEYTEGFYTYKVEEGNAVIVAADASVEGDIIVPDTLGGYKVVWIHKHSFKDNTGITTVTIGKNLTWIQNEAFEGCVNLSRFIVNEENALFSTDEYGVLYSKNKDALIYFPPANGIENYTIPDSVERISAKFHDCGSLKTLTIPESVEHIDTNFNECTALTDIYYGGIERKWGTLDGSKYGMSESITVHFREENLKDKMEQAKYEFGAFIGPVMFFGFYFVIGLPFAPIALFLAFLQDLGLITVRPY